MKNDYKKSNHNPVTTRHAWEQEQGLEKHGSKIFRLISSTNTQNDLDESGRLSAAHTVPGPAPFLTCNHWAWSLRAAAQAFTLPRRPSRAYSGLHERSSMPKVRCTVEADSWESCTSPERSPSSSEQPDRAGNRKHLFNSLRSQGWFGIGADSSYWGSDIA